MKKRKENNQEGELNNKESREVWLDNSTLSEISAGETTEGDEVDEEEDDDDDDES